MPGILPLIPAKSNFRGRGMDEKSEVRIQESEFVSNPYKLDKVDGY
jgi:hypothetical protein